MVKQWSVRGGCWRWGRSSGVSGVGVWPLGFLEGRRNWSRGNASEGFLRYVVVGCSKNNLVGE